MRCATQSHDFFADLSERERADAKSSPRGAPGPAQIEPDSSRDAGRFWAKAGAMVMLRVEHRREVDPNRLARHLMVATLDMVRCASPPCSPLFPSVGLMFIADPAFRTVRIVAAEGFVSTMVPLLVTVLHKEAALEWEDQLFDYLETATEELNYCTYAPYLAQVSRIVVPLPERQVPILERRCIGSPVCGKLSIA